MLQNQKVKPLIKLPILDHWKEHRAEHKRLVMKINQEKKQKPNDRCACGSKKHCTRSVVDLKRDKNVVFIN